MVLRAWRIILGVWRKELILSSRVESMAIITHSLMSNTEGMENDVKSMARETRLIKDDFERLGALLCRHYSNAKSSSEVSSRFSLKSLHRHLRIQNVTWKILKTPVQQQQYREIDMHVLQR